MSWTLAGILILLIAANGAPVLGWLLLHDRYNHPIDNNRTLRDGHPLFGSSKTWRGLAFSLCITTPVALLLGMTWQTGLVIATGAMLGDLFSSFLKRRMSMPSSSMALGLDQIPEALVPLLLTMHATGLGWSQVAVLVVLFLVLELSLSRALYHLHLRKRPY